MRPTTKAAYDFFHKGALAMSRLEQAGFKVDVEYLDRQIHDTAAVIALYEKELHADPLYELWRKRFKDRTNLRSGEQLGEVVYGILEYPCLSHTDTGKPQTDQEAMRHVLIKEPFVAKLFKMKKMDKVLGTYLRGIRREVGADGFLRPSYNLAGGFGDDTTGGAASYRSSCSDPNMQNVPIRNDDMAALIRPCFVPRSPKRRVIERDFAGIEVRTAAFYNQDPVLIDYIKDPTKDMHRDMAAQLFVLAPGQVEKKTTRDAAKNLFVFPQFYGSYYKDCARGLWEAMIERGFKVGGSGILVKDHLKKKGIIKRGACDGTEPLKGTFEYHVKEVEKDFWGRRFRVYEQWKHKWYAEYKENGYFDLLTGFRCRGYYRRNAVINYPVQGVAFHCLLWVIIRLQEEIDRLGMKTLIIGQIHDSVIADVPDTEVQQYLDLSTRVMSVDLPKTWAFINVPIETEVDVTPCGRSWYEKKAWAKNPAGRWEEVKKT